MNPTVPSATPPFPEDGSAARGSATDGSAADGSGEARTWQAYRYWTGELSVDETAAFEAELATDQALRETLAQVVLVQQALEALPGRSWTGSACGNSPAAPPLEAASEVLSRTEVPTNLSRAERPAREERSVRWWQPASWMALGAAASMIGMLGWQAWTASGTGDVVANNSGPATPETASLEALSRVIGSAQLANHWPGLPGVLPAPADQDFESDHDGYALESVEPVPADAGVQGPSWTLMALSQVAREQRPSPPPPTTQEGTP